MINTSQGRNIKDFRSQDADENRQNDFRRILLPYLVLIASQLPLSLVYLKGLWDERTYYQLFPIAIAGALFFLFLRWPRNDEPRHFPSTLSDIFLVTGVLLGVLGTFLLSPWFGFAAFLCLFGSLLARTNDRQVFGTLLPAIAPLIVLLQPPAAIDFDTVQGDILLMSTINTGATKIASDSLDLMQYPHNVSESRMEFPVGIFDSTGLGNNSLSLFTLLIVTGLFITWQRIPVFRGVMLLLAACFWSMTFEALELIVCAVAETNFEKDFYSPGTSNRMMQLAGLFGAGLMTLLSDRLIAFLFGPVDVHAIDENVSYQDLLCRFWNSAIAGVSSPIIDVNVKKEVAWANRRNSSPSALTSTALWGSGILLGVLGLIQVIGLGSAMSRSGESVFADGGAVSLNRNSLPATISGLVRTGYEHQEPSQQSIYEAHDHRWIYADAEDNEYQVVISQPYTGWHDNDRKIKSYDWDRETEPELREIQVGDDNLQYVYASYRNNLAEYRSAYNFQMDGYGRGFEVPLMWRSPGDFLRRGFSRLGDRTRPRVISGLSLEISVFVESVGPNSNEDKQHAERLFMNVVQQVYSSVNDGSFGSASNSTE